MSKVVIAGGGPAGLAAAIALAERGVPAQVVDATGGMTAQRGELLPHGAAAIMDRLGLAHVLQTSLRIEDVVSRWGPSHPNAHGAHPTLGLHGWGINRQALAAAMLERVQALGVEVITARVTGQHRTDTAWQVTLNGAETRSAPYLIDATGRPAALARRLGATLLQDTDLVALTWQIGDTGPAAMQSEATPDGWWYSVPHAKGATLGFVTSAANAKQINAAPDSFLTKARDDVTLIPVASASGAPWMMDSRSAVLDKACDTGWLATGDAAAAFDPIASQGMFNALSAGFFAGHAAADTLAGDADAPMVYAALAARTAERTHSTTHLQYAALPFDTPFWQDRSRLSG